VADWVKHTSLLLCSADILSTYLYSKVSWVLSGKTL